LIVSLSGTNLPGVPVNTSATFRKEKLLFKKKQIDFSQQT